MKSEDIERLLEKYRSGNCSPEEVLILEEHFDRLVNKAVPPTPISETSVQSHVDHTWSKVLSLTDDTQPEKLWVKVILSAAAFLAVSMMVYFFDFPVNLNKREKPLFADIAPGGNKATLTLANGKKIALDDAANGSLAKESGIEIVKTADGRIIYKVIAGGAKPGKNEYNTIETPMGGQYQIALPDGTQVWLNAASSLLLPTSTYAFSQKRTVELRGEAYFEVTKDPKHPFIVKTGTQQVQVLGTRFNVEAYPEELAIKTTLAEGSVKVYQSSLNNVASATIPGEKILSPGQQSLNKNGVITVSEVNLSDALAWKDGYLILDDDTFEGTMNKISRWYDVQVVYEYKPVRINIGGLVPRSQKLSAVLELMEESGKVHFNLEGRRLTVIK